MVAMAAARPDGPRLDPPPGLGRLGPMLLQFFTGLREARVPVSLREYLTLLRAMESDLADKRVEEFYFLARTVLVKDESNLDRFDRVFASVFKGLETLGEAVEPAAIPEEWLRKLAEKYLTEAEKAELKALGWDKLFETLKQRLGYNPEGIRIGQDGNRNFRAVKVWDKREFKDLDDARELGTRSMRVALRRLRRFARTGAAEELDLDGTIRESARKGFIDVRLRPERRNAVKVLLFLDVGGSMDWHVELAEELFSAARSEFKHFAHYYFHNCPYEAVWTENHRRHYERIPLLDVIRTYGSDYRVVFVGDASMSPYEIAHPGGSVEHWNEEAGEVWLGRILDHFPKAVWLNPVPAEHWAYTQSIGMVRRIFSERMFPLTLEGLDGAMRALLR